MKTEKFTQIGEKTPNITPEMCEDRLFISNNLIAVIDGATSTSGVKINGLTDGAYISEYFIGELDGFSNSKLEAKDILSTINKSFGEHLKKDYPEIAALGRNGPTASALIIKVMHDDTYTYAQVGDCMLIEKDNIQFTELTVDARHHDDQYYIQKAWNMAKIQNKSIIDLRQSQEIIQDIINQRLQSNISTGTLNGDHNMDNFICHGKRPITKKMQLALMSDGMAHPDFPVESSYIEAAKFMIDNGVQNYYKTMKSIYNTDINWKNLKYPRFKHMDDATAVVVTF